MEKKALFFALTHVFAELNHPPGAVQALIRDLVGLELQGLQLRERRALILTVGRHPERARLSRSDGIKAESEIDATEVQRESQRAPLSSVCVCSALLVTFSSLFRKRGFHG